MSASTWLWRTAQLDLPELWLQAGLTSAQIEQLVKLTQTDTLIQQTTHDLERFSSIATVQTWLKGPRKVVALQDVAGQLLGLVWVSQKPLPSIDATQLLPVWQKRSPVRDPAQYQLTFGMRLYGQARGKGLAQEFFTAAVNYCMQAGGFKGKLWLLTKSTNVPAIKAYRKLGFEQITQPNHDDEIIMIQL